MIGLAAEDLVDVRRWAICGALVVGAHAGLAAAMVTWSDSERSVVAVRRHRGRFRSDRGGADAGGKRDPPAQSR